MSLGTTVAKTIRGWIRPPSASTVFFLVVGFVASAPAWIVRHPPLQDMPFHLSTIRVIHDFGDPALHFQDDYELNLAHTAYILYYLLGTALAYLLGAYKANVLLMSLYLGGTPLALRSFLIALKKDERLALFAVPLVVNVMFLYGLMPFVFGIPVMFLAMAAAVRWFEQPTRERGIWLGVLAVALFYSHVFPFGVFGVAFAAMFPWSKPREWVRFGLPVVPALLCVAWWVKFSPAGSAAAKGLGGSAQAAPSVPAPLDVSLTQFFDWSTNVFTDQSDEKWFILLAVLAIVSTGLSQGEPDGSIRRSRPYVAVLVACIACYFLLGDHLGIVWLLAQRFPVPALLCAIPLLRIPRGTRGILVASAVTLVGVGSTINVCQHFIRFEREEVGALDDAIDSMKPGKKVCGLIFDKGTAITRNVPFLHYVSYYQADKGGLVMFSYADFPHWPFRYKEGHFPPPGTSPRLRWEWTPEQTPINEIYPYYDYVLVRGSGFSPPPGTYHESFHDGRWTVFERDGAKP
jgi:MFS family permease